MRRNKNVFMSPDKNSYIFRSILNSKLNKEKTKLKSGLYPANLKDESLPIWERSKLNKKNNQRISGLKQADLSLTPPHKSKDFTYPLVTALKGNGASQRDKSAVPSNLKDLNLFYSNSFNPFSL